MRYLLIAAGLIFAALFGLSAMASDATVDFKYPTGALQTSGLTASGGICTPSAAQAVTLTIVKNSILAGGYATIATTRPCAMPGGASLGVGSYPQSLSLLMT